MQNITIIGAGAIGTALAKILEHNPAARVRLFDKDAEKVPAGTQPLPTLVARADAVFLCVPSWVMRQAVSDIVPSLTRGATVVSLAKGLEAESKKSMDALLAELLPEGQPLVVLGGPMLAREFMEGMRGSALIASSSRAAAERVANLFRDTMLVIEISDDVRGVAISGVLKNIYAFGLGMAAAIGWGNNEKGWFVTRTLAEMAGLMEILGGRRETAYSLAGVGDLVATGFSSYSRNNRAGEEIAKNGVCSIQSEGCVSLPVLVEILGEKRSSFPVLSLLERVILKGEDARAAFNLFASGG